MNIKMYSPNGGVVSTHPSNVAKKLRNGWSVKPPKKTKSPKQTELSKKEKF